MSDWLSVAEVAEELQTGKRPIYKAIRCGALKAAPVTDRGDLRIAREWLTTWLETRAARETERVR
jgi:excisionase family DNA binding protein